MIRSHDVRSLSDFEAKFHHRPSTLAPIHLAPVHLADVATLRQFGRLPVGGLAMRQVERVID